MNTDEFIRYEVWNDYWCFKPKHNFDLNILDRLNFSSGRIREDHEILLEAKENQKLPTEYQISTLNFIRENQGKIVESIFEYYKNVILPVYQHATDIEQEEIAKTRLELSKVFGKLFVKIPSLSYLNYFQYVIEFDFNYDPEHGTSILFQNESPIDFFEGGGNNYWATLLYEKLVNEGKSIRTKLNKLNGETVFQESYKYDEKITFNLKKGTYRTFIQIGGSELCRNFYVPNDLNEFTLRKILTNK